MKTLTYAERAEEVELSREHDKIALALGILLPGLGQIYKGHYLMGSMWLLVGMPTAIWMGVLLSLATLGLGFLLPLACWAGLALDAYCEPDRREHYLMHLL